MPAPESFTLNQVTKSFEGPDGSRNLVIDSMDMTLLAGSFTSIVGPSGCGKTTLLRLVAGLITPDSGQILHNNKPLRRNEYICGYVPQASTLFPWLAARENIAFGLRILNASRNHVRTRTQELLEMTHLSEYADYYPSELSGGMQQRIAVARALATEPAVLLLDEPFGALDAQTREDMQIFLLDVWAKTKVTVMFITHDVEEAILLADTIHVCSRAPMHILETNSVPFERPRTPTIRDTQAFQRLRRQISERFKS